MKTIIKIVSILALSAGLLYTQKSKADPISCQCPSGLTKRNAALNYGPGDHLVFDINTNTIERWIVENSGPEIDVPMRIGANSKNSLQATGRRATAGPVPEMARNELYVAHRISVEAGGTINPTYVVHLGQNNIPGWGLTAYDVVRDKNLQAQIVSRISQESFINQVVTSSVRSYFSELYSIASSIIGLKGEASMRFKVMGADGSHFIVHITASTPTGQYIAGSARSAGGELIPEETSQIKNGTWTGGSTGYGSGALDSMVDHFDRLGATIQFIGGGGSSGGGGAIATIIVCDEKTCYVYLENPR